MGGGGDINFTRANCEGDTIIDDDVCCVLRIVCIVTLLVFVGESSLATLDTWNRTEHDACMPRRPGRAQLLS